jgi:hypothetical protein
MRGPPFSFLRLSGCSNISLHFRYSGISAVSDDPESFIRKRQKKKKSVKGFYFLKFYPVRLFGENVWGLAVPKQQANVLF